MATNFLWGTRGSIMNLLTTELDGLASGSGSATGPEINNSTGYQAGLLHLHLQTSALALTTASYVKVFALPSDNGSTYPNYTSGATYKLAESNYLIASIALHPVTQSSTVVDEWVGNVPLPDGKFKAVLVNQAGSTLPAHGNTLDIYPTPTQY